MRTRNYGIGKIFLSSLNILSILLLILFSNQFTFSKLLNFFNLNLYRFFFQTLFQFLNSLLISLLQIFSILMFLTPIFRPQAQLFIPLLLLDSIPLLLLDSRIAHELPHLCLPLCSYSHTKCSDIRQIPYLCNPHFFSHKSLISLNL